MRATRILAFTILLGAGSLPAAVQFAPANRAEPSVGASAGQQPADTARAGGSNVSDPGAGSISSD